MSKIKNTRKIAVILVADVAGYSKLMEQDEDRTLANFKDCRTIFEALLDDLGMTFEELAADTELLETVVLYHVVPGTVKASDVLSLTEGALVPTV